MKRTLLRDQRYILHTYRRNRLWLVRGRGMYVWDHAGRRYLDMFSGLSVTSIGHAHPAIVRAVCAQVKRLTHVSNLYYTTPQIDLAERLSKRTLGGRVFFCNSGAEATEGAIKIARKWGAGKRHEIITFTGSFHGRTLGALSATGQEKFQKGFGPLVPGFRYAKFNDINSVQRAIGPRTVGIFIEAVQGEGGVHVARADFLRDVARVCTEHKLLFVCDEVQCGLGRTGHFCAYEDAGIRPDIVYFAKGLGGGLPLGAVVVTPALNETLGFGEHGSTFGGNPICCSAGCAVLDAIDERLLAHVRRVGAYFLRELERLADLSACVKEVRGRGLMLGMELTEPGSSVVKACQARGLLINCTQETVVRFLPPFMITERDVDTAVRILRAALPQRKRSGVGT